MFACIVIFPLAYLLGSIPSSVWLGKAFRGIDLREHGSGNAGATNAFRVLGKPIGIGVLLADMGKGYLAVSLAHLQNQVMPESETWMILQILLGFMAVAGHIFPLFARFRGGKGVATLAGAGLALHPYAALAAMGVYLLVFLISKTSAVGSLSAVLSYPIWVMAIFRSEYKALWLFSIIVPVLVVFTHRSNIFRLLKGKKTSLPGSGA
jgi:glycerol-3-phosphate acyltransferase PlsY